MEDFKLAESLIALMMDLRYIKDKVSVKSISLDENDDIWIALESNEPNDRVVVPRKIWDLRSMDVFESWVRLLIAADEEQENDGSNSIFYDLTDPHKDFVKYIYQDICEQGAFSNCQEDTDYYKAQLELIHRLFGRKPFENLDTY